MDVRRFRPGCVHQGPSQTLSLHRPNVGRESRSLRPIGGVLLDVCGVLYDASLWHRWLFQLVSRMGLHTHYASFFRVWRREYLESVFCGQRDYWEALRAFLLTAGLSRSQIDEIQAAGQARQRQFETDIRPLPRVAPTLAQFAAQGLHLGVLAYAPWTAEVLQNKLRQLRLDNFFGTALSCYDLRSISWEEQFQTALAAMRLAAGDVAYIGHDSHMLAAARSIGLQTVAVNYDADAEADVYVEQLDELLQLVQPNALHMLAG